MWVYLVPDQQDLLFLVMGHLFPGVGLLLQLLMPCLQLLNKAKFVKESKSA